MTLALSVTIFRMILGRRDHGALMNAFQGSPQCIVKALVENASGSGAQLQKVGVCLLRAEANRSIECGPQV